MAAIKWTLAKLVSLVGLCLVVGFVLYPIVNRDNEWERIDKGDNYSMIKTVNGMFVEEREYNRAGQLIMRRYSDSHHRTHSVTFDGTTGAELSHVVVE